MPARHPETPDGRYFVIGGRLWRLANPLLEDDERKSLVSALTKARRTVRDANRSGDEKAEAEAHRAVDAAKHALGERGPVWWNDGAPDLNRHMVNNTPYADWYAGLDNRSN
jgi:hypothetical protein